MCLVKVHERTVNACKVNEIEWKALGHVCMCNFVCEIIYSKMQTSRDFGFQI